MTRRSTTDGRRDENAFRLPKLKRVSDGRARSRCGGHLVVHRKSLARTQSCSQDARARPPSAITITLRRRGPGVPLDGGGRGQLPAQLGGDGAAVSAVVRAVRGLLRRRARHVRGEGGGGPLRRQPARHARALPRELRRVPAAGAAGVLSMRAAHTLVHAARNPRRKVCQPSRIFTGDHSADHR